MVEIARAAADPRLKLLILDEPTSSLDAARAHELTEYLRRRAREGLAVVFIGHKLGEILELAEDFLVMRDGRLVWSGSRAETDHEKLVTLMSAEVLALQELKTGERVEVASRRPNIAGRETPLVEISEKWQENAKSGPLKLFRGEIIGLAGLEGSGQQSLLFGVYAASRQEKNGITRKAPAAYVAGDRRKEGGFPALDDDAEHDRGATDTSRRARAGVEPGRKGMDRIVAGPLQLHCFSHGTSDPATQWRQPAEGSHEPSSDRQADVILLNDPTRRRRHRGKAGVLRGAA